MKGLYCCFSLLILSFCTSLCFGQSGNFRTIATGSWNSVNTWERDADGNGTFEISPTDVVPTTITGTVTIQAAHTISYNVTLTNVNAGGTVIVNGIINWNTLIPLKVMNINNNGSLQNNGTINSSNISRLKFNAGSSYYHLFVDGGTIPLAGWNPTSTVHITGFGSGASIPPSGLNQTFGNFTWNTPSFDNYIDLGGAPAIINGDFTITSTGAGAFGYNSGSGSNTTFSIGGDFSISSGQFGFVSGTGNPGVLNINTSLTAAKGLKMSGGYLQIGGDDNITINVTGIVDLADGDVELSAESATTTFNVSGDYTHSSGNLYSSGGTSTINFNGTSTQIFTSTVLPVGDINYNVPLNATLSIPASSFLSGTGTFTLSGTLEVGSTNTSGAIQNTGSAGNIRVSGLRTYNGFSTIIYSGTAGQFIGNGHPTTAGVNTTIDNSSGVSLIVGVPIIITTDLTLINGNLNIGNGSLTLNGTLDAGDNNITIGSGGSITISGSGTIGTFPFPSGTQTFTNFTLDNPNGVTFGTNVVLTGLLTLTNGSLAFPAMTLTLNGTFAATGSGDLSPSNTSTLAIGGSGSFGTLRINTTNNTVHTFTFSRASSGTASLNSTLIVNNTFNLTNGTFTNANGLSMAHGSTIIRNSNGELLGNAPSDLPSNEFYNVTYTGSSMTTGFELPTVERDMLGTLTINGGPVLLDKNIQVRANVALLNSNLNANGFDISLSASPGTWTKTNGAFVGGSGTVIVKGNISIVGTNPNFTNITTNAGSTLTLPTANINIAGNLQLNASSTFSNNSGTITLNGAGDQLVAGTGKSFNNIIVNKSAGFVTLTPSLNLIGILNIQSVTEFRANGNLTLISTSDGPSGNASIAKIPSGASVTGNVIVQRRMSGEGRIYRDISSPIQSATVQQIMNSGITVTGFSGSSFPCAGCATNGPSMYSYNEAASGAISNGYEAVNSAAQTLTPGKGYNVLVRSEVGTATMSLTGPINSGTISFNAPSIISYTSSGNAGDGWNFVGNPYPSSIDWDNGWTKANVQGNMIAVWDAGANQYKYWNGSTGSLGSGILAQGQGFWFQASGAPSLSVTEDSKVSSTGAFYRKESEEVHFMELIVSGKDVEDRAYIQKRKGANSGFDNMDGSKFPVDNFSLATISSDKKTLAINAVGEVPTSGEMSLVVTNLQAGDYNFMANFRGEFDGLNVSVFDRYKNTMNFLGENGYSFSVTNDVNSQSSDRFVLVFGDRIFPEGNRSGLSIYPNPVDDKLNVFINAMEAPTGEVIDTRGKSIGSLVWEKLDESNNWVGHFDTSSQPAGMYLVKVRLLQGMQVVKFIKD